MNTRRWNNPQNQKSRGPLILYSSIQLTADYADYADAEFSPKKILKFIQLRGARAESFGGLVIRDIREIRGFNCGF